MKIFINLSLISDFLSGLSTLICRWLYLLKKVRPEWRQEEELACSDRESQIAQKGRKKGRKSRTYFNVILLAIQYNS